MQKALRILVVDDGALNRRLCERLLASLGCTVVSVGDMESAVAEAGGAPFDLVLTDIMMPGGDGVTGLARLREALKTADGRTTAVVAMSGQALGSDPEAYRQAGFDDYLPKPVMLDALREGIERWVAGARRD